MTSAKTEKNKPINDIMQNGVTSHTPLSSAISTFQTQQWQYQSKSGDIINGHHRLGKSGHPNVHFLHGTGFSSKTLLPVAAMLPNDWGIWLTDVPGHGKSTQPNNKMPNWQSMADTIASAITATDSQLETPAIGIGHSMGGILTLLAAAKHPHLFSKVILLDPVLFKTEILIAQQLMRATGLWKKSALVRSVTNRRASWSNQASMLSELRTKPLYSQWQPEVLRLFTDDASDEKTDGSRHLRCSPRWEGSIFGSYPKGLWKAIRKIDIPVEILVAEKSYSFIPQSAKKAAKINSNIHWQTFGNRHCFPMEQPIETAQLIQQCIK